MSRSQRELSFTLIPQKIIHDPDLTEVDPLKLPEESTMTLLQEIPQSALFQPTFPDSTVQLLKQMSFPFSGPPLLSRVEIPDEQRLWGASQYPHMGAGGKPRRR